MFKKGGLLIFLLALLLVFISIRSASPPPLKDGAIADSTFSVKRAFTHLEAISKAPHSTGTAENARVREYIITVCQQLGFEVEVQNVTSINNRRNIVHAANIYNIIARRKGLQNSKSVMLMAHYDSEPNTVGAGDDGTGVAATLETARALHKTAPLRNDLVLLFTDGEEIGLLGARAFVNESPLLKEIGLVINFEGRGNAGPSNMFEVNAENGWAINGYAKSAAHPFANSLGYEIYKKLPNITDYTIFKDAGITGLNNAYIDGFVNYHSANDKPKNMDLGSFQHHGENMLSLTKYFGNLNITVTKAPDVSYFNFIGYWFLHYPASWNMFFVVLVDLLFVVYIIAGIRKERIRIGGLIISAILFPVVLAIIYFMANYFLRKIISFYPLYSHFDENNSYNSGWYFLAMSALALAVFSGIYALVSKKINSHALLAGLLLTVVILMNFMQASIPSASYLLFIPLLFILGIHLFILSKNVFDKNLSLKWEILYLLSVTPAIFLLAPTIHSTYIAFALGPNMPFVVLGTGLLAGLLLPVFYPLFHHQKLLVPLIAFSCFLLAIAGGHFTAGYSERNPLQSGVYYALDADSSKARWISEFKTTDKWSAQFFKHSGSSGPMILRDMLVNGAPVLSISAPLAVMKNDTLYNGKRKVAIHFSAARENVVWMKIIIADSSNAGAISINGKQAGSGKDRSNSYIVYHGITGAGFDVTFEMDAGKKLGLTVTDAVMNLPMVPGFNTSYPNDIIPTQGRNSNTTQVSRRFIF